MPFVRRAELADRERLAGFDEWGRATEASIDAGECFVAGHDADVLDGELFRIGRRPLGALDFNEH